MAAMIADSTALFRYQGKPIADSARWADTSVTAVSACRLSIRHAWTMTSRPEPPARMAVSVGATAQVPARSPYGRLRKIDMEPVWKRSVT